MGRPIGEVRLFGRLVEQERLRLPNANLSALFKRVALRDSRRWGSRATWYRLWAAYKKDLAGTPEPR
jgi:hypothetical protein